MSQKTIQCQLFTDETARKYLWQLMAERNTPLVNELLRLVALHPDFPTWRSKGKLPSAEVTKLAKTLKAEPRFQNQPAKFYISAEKTASYTFKSWLALQKRVQQQLVGKLSWLQMLRTDEELASDCGRGLETIKQEARKILLKLASQAESGESKRKLRPSLYKVYESTDDVLVKSAIAYLLKNKCHIPEQDAEKLQKFAKYRRKLELQVKRLAQQLENRLPQGRDLKGERFLNALELAANSVPVDEEEAARWQSHLSEKIDLLPFPIVLESNMDLMWFATQEGKIGLHIGGISECEFEIGCGQRQLPYFQQFLSDYQTMLASKRQHTSSLFLLRSAKVLWMPNKSRRLGEGADITLPWNCHQLYLSCTLDTRLLSAEGTELVRAEVAETTAKVLQKMREKSDRTHTQDNYIKRLQSTLDKLEQPFNRPSKPLYQGSSNVIVGVSMGLKSPVAAIAIDLITQKVIAYRSTKQLLGDNYRLLNRQRNLQAQQRHLRHKAQKRGISSQASNSELGQHLDRLFAKAIVELAQSYGAGSIALPKLESIRADIQAEVDAIAQQKIPGYLEGQKKYTRQLRINLHNWSYHRLSQSIIDKAAQYRIFIEYGDNNLANSSRASPLEGARNVALSAYAKRTVEQIVT